MLFLSRNPLFLLFAVLKVIFVVKFLLRKNVYFGIGRDFSKINIIINIIIWCDFGRGH